MRLPLNSYHPVTTIELFYGGFYVLESLKCTGRKVVPHPQTAHALTVVDPWVQIMAIW